MMFNRYATCWLSRCVLAIGASVLVWGVSLYVPSPILAQDAEQPVAEAEHSEPAAEAVDADAAGHDPANPDAVDHGDEHHETGVPLAAKPDLLIWSLVTFVVFLLVLGKLAWGPLIDGLNKREQKMFQAVAEAQSARNEAAALLAEHKGQMEAVDEQVKEILAEARRDADHTKNDIVATAQREAEATKERAISEINRAKDQALKELFDRMSDQVAEATETVVGRSLDSNDQKRLIEEALSQFGNQSA